MIPSLPCPGYVAVSIPLFLIAFLLIIVFVAEFLRRERTNSKDDDWVQFHREEGEGIADDSETSQT